MELVNMREIEEIVLGVRWTVTQIFDINMNSVFYTVDYIDYIYIYVTNHQNHCKCKM